MEEQLMLALARFSRLITDAEDDAKEHLDFKDLTSTQINYLETMRELNNPNITELAIALGLKKPSVTVVVERLIEKGCVYKTPSDADRRTSHLHLTDVGRQINLRHDYAHQTICRRVTERLTEEQAQEFVELLNMVVGNSRTTESE